ncbi:MAG TPA: phosphoadenosine phosphosulfate reductase family protein, partial [Chloroflexota bacterium]|nr:phosphoadenosine phosphosulfate reductase family protein [Chloroflexota bacterium]
MAIALPDSKRVVFDDFEAGQLGVELDDREPQEILEWAMETFGDRVSICTSFQSDGMAILDMATRIDSNVRVFTVDTGRLPQETYDFMEAVRRRYGVTVDVYLPETR